MTGKRKRYGADEPVLATPDTFTLAMMTRNNSKDLLLLRPGA